MSCWLSIQRAYRPECWSICCDIVIKFKTFSGFSKDLKETLNTLSHFWVKLNPTKCSFGVRSGKLLGHRISNQGLRVNPDKIKDVMEIRSPRTLNEVQKLIRCLAGLSQFLCKAIERHLPFYQGLKRVKSFIREKTANRPSKSLRPPSPTYLSSSPPKLERHYNSTLLVIKSN